MDPARIAVAQRCLDSATDNAMTFPQVVGTLLEAGFESYTADFRRGVAIYYMASGESVELASPIAHGSVAETFDAVEIQAAIREAQQLVPGYTYKGFCAKVMAAGCVGYVVSFLGRRAVYSGRTGETHVEAFPPAS